MSPTKNPARSRPLSRNVKRLMRMAREAPENPEIEKIERMFTERDLAYCDMQGSIFMAAVDRGFEMSEFAPVYMNSQLAGVIDYSFSCAGGMEEDDISTYLRMPVLLKSPDLIVDTVMWLNRIMSGLAPEESASAAIVLALTADENNADCIAYADISDTKQLVERYEYAYWLGYIYRCECHMHDESSRMVLSSLCYVKIIRKFYVFLFS